MALKDEEFVDAPEVFTTVKMDLKHGIRSAHDALDLFLNNRFEDAKNKLEPYAKQDMYHALGFATVKYLRAAITMEGPSIQEASDSVKNCLVICQKSRKKATISDTFKLRNKAQLKQEYSKYTDEQCHAELCYAESLLQKAFLTFVMDENLMALIKGGLKIRECYRTYKDCWNILKVKEWSDSYLRDSFESGVRLGVGAFNLMISMLPTKVLKLLEFVGFKGNKMFGLCELNKAAAYENNLRQPLATLILLTFHSFVGVLIGLYPYTEHILESKRLISPCLAKYPKSAIFELFRARLELIQGQFDKAVNGYESSISCQSEWKNLHDICHWELLWCYVIQGDWLLGMKYAEKLSQQSKWSKSIYLYQKAVFLIECYSESSETVSDEMKKHLRQLLETVPKVTQRFAGKSIPLEKFAVKKAKRYFDQNSDLILPGVELLFIWNGFKIMGHQRSIVEKFLKICTNKLDSITNSTEDKSQFYFDNVALATLLKAVSLRYLNRFAEAKALMLDVVGMEKKIKEDTYIVPYTYYEIAQIEYAEEKYDEVQKSVDKAKSYKSYSLESRLHFRLHALNLQLRRLTNGEVQSSFSWEDSLCEEAIVNNNCSASCLDSGNIVDCEVGVRTEEYDSDNDNDFYVSISDSVIKLPS